ncbi:protein disulfide isomerase [Trypanosoma grayi]|uniref:protein disulfide isomerase n=1 Tax=Trypanosoma grayi TaxID=71804 RepID=UPI0004F41382|nr:protein disulfide isomerase [Trypanosoma grayi]KEG13961.1 protein disulfide isomerase [Trypanosoma grayi]
MAMNSGRTTAVTLLLAVSAAVLAALPAAADMRRFRIEGKPINLHSADTKVVQLDAETFEKTVNDPSKHVFVFFYVTWCDRSCRMFPKWETLAEDMKDVSDVVFADIDAGLYGDIAERYGVHGFPTLRLFTKGNKEGVVYHGPRDVTALKSFVKGIVW